MCFKRVVNSLEVKGFNFFNPATSLSMAFSSLPLSNLKVKTVPVFSNT